MSTTLEPRHADDVEDALIQLDADYSTIYGPDLAVWSRGVRGEYLEQLRARRTMNRETHPLHPRKASAGRRRRHRAQLAYRIHRIAPGAATVLLNPYWVDGQGPFERVYIATARTTDGDRISLPRGGSRRLATLTQGAFPAADWNQPQTWHADGNQLTTWQGRRFTS
ncbi:hypothetical protein AB0D78_28525 [Streptomyces avermitilis]|uniref:hypothetical protein n=1 Tax=Streptomyces avermitilis TaxID=33903 RepID=UPI0033CFE194